MGLGFLLLLVSCSFSVECDPKPGTPTISPIGTAKGINPGRVVWVRDPLATTWSGNLSTWWTDHIDEDRVALAFKRSLLNLTDSSDLTESWLKLLKSYQNGDGISIKVNMNNHELSYGPSNGNGLSPQYLVSLIASIVYDGGIAEQDICVFDGARAFGDAYYNPIRKRFPSVDIQDNVGKNGRVGVQPDMHQTLHFSNTEIPAYNATHVPTCVTNAKFHITVDNLRGHDIAGITASAKNFFGAIWRPECAADSKECSCLWPWGDTGHWCPRDLHPFVSARKNCMGTYTPLVDLLGYQHFTSVLYLCDGLMGGPNEHADPPVPFLSAPFNNHWSSSVFASQDPIALDSVIYDILRNEPNIPCASEDGWCIDNYLHEAALCPNSPSGTMYRPNGPESSPLNSLGVHEHWISAQDRQYSRNLKTGFGIELIEIGDS